MVAATEDPSRRQASDLLSGYVDEARCFVDTHGDASSAGLPRPLHTYATGRRMLAADGVVRAQIVGVGFAWLVDRLQVDRHAESSAWDSEAQNVGVMLRRLYRTRPDYVQADLDAIVSLVLEVGPRREVLCSERIDLVTLLADIAASAVRRGFTDHAQSELRRVYERLDVNSRDQFDVYCLRHSISVIIERLSYDPEQLRLFRGEPQRDGETAGTSAKGVIVDLIEGFLIDVSVQTEIESRQRGDRFVPLHARGPESFSTGRAIMNLPGNERALVVAGILDLLPSIDHWFAPRNDDDASRLSLLLLSVVSGLPRLPEEALLPIIERLIAEPQAAGYGSLIFNDVVVRSIGRSVPSPEMRAAITRLQAAVLSASRRSTDTLARIERILMAGISSSVIEQADDWGHAASSALDHMDGDVRGRWEAVLRHAATLSGTKPSRKWLDAGRPLIEAMGVETFTRTVAEWLRLMQQPTRNEEYRRPGGVMMPTALVSEHNSDVLKGLAWCCTLVPSDALASALGDGALGSFRKIPEIGARSTKGGNACVGALGAMPNLAAVAQLQRIAGRVKLPSARKMIEGALNAAAKLHGLSRADLDDLAIPTFGLVDGVARTELGGHVAELAIGGADGAELRFVRPDGTVLRGVPAEVKRAFPEQLKTLQQTVKEARSALHAQRTRLEGLYLAERDWQYAGWRERYLEHPLLAGLVRRLIWTFDGVAGIWMDGEIVGQDGMQLEIAAGARVQLWHPIGVPADTVLAWREWLERHAVTQPFKQAHREVYILTDAERATETYSNRFAAHILRQHQLHALCRERGWEYRLQGGFDSGGGMPSLTVPGWGLRAELYVEPVEGGDDSFSHAGIYLFVATDQVRFTRTDAPRNAWSWHFPEAVPLHEVPPLVLSEVLRDVDLFTGVCSVGADPEWPNRGDGLGTRYHEYWSEVSFGELSEVARTRREVLQRLLPHLSALESRWALDERYLTVRGDLRTYRIHIGSGNVLMEPNAQYLCIVPGGGAGSIGSTFSFLPFDGDRLLSIVISKALLLANDTAITDRTIIRQIKAA